MPTLFDTLSRKLSGQDDDATPIAGQQQQLQSALQAKTGKAVGPSSGPAASNVTEQAAIAQGQTQLAQGAQQAQLAGTQVQQAADTEKTAAQTAAATTKQTAQLGQKALATQAASSAAQTAGTEALANSQTQAGETLKIQAINSEADKQARQLAADGQLSLDNIFRQFKASQQDLAFRKDAAQLEHVGQVLALRDKSYVDEITRIGQERGLDDEINFKEESERLTLGNQLDQLDQQLGFKAAMNANQRQWDAYLAGMNADAAMMIAQAAVKAQSQNEVFTGVGTAASAGIDAYVKSQKYGSDDTTNVQNQTPTSPYTPYQSPTNPEPNDYVSAGSANPDASTAADGVTTTGGGG